MAGSLTTAYCGIRQEEIPLAKQQHMKSVFVQSLLTRPIPNGQD